MGIRKYNPTTPGLRGMTVSTFEEITETTPEKSLTVAKLNTGSSISRETKTESPETYPRSNMILTEAQTSL